MADLKALRGSRGRIMAAVMNAIIPRGGAYAPGAADFDLLPRADAFIMSMNPMARLGFPFLLYYLQFGALLRTGRTLTGLPEEKASAYLERFDESRVYYRRMIILALKMITMIAFYDIDKNAAIIGYTHLRHRKGARRAGSGAKPRAKAAPGARGKDAVSPPRRSDAGKRR